MVQNHMSTESLSHTTVAKKYMDKQCEKISLLGCLSKFNEPSYETRYESG